MSYVEVPGTLADGTPYSLRRPRVHARRNAGAAPRRPPRLPRIAPPVFGLGLLEALSEPAILANADPDDADGDGISGRPNHVWDRTTGAVAVGRFGWKANTASVLQQTAAAYNGDMGVTSSFMPAEPWRACPGASLTRPT